MNPPQFHLDPDHPLPDAFGRVRALRWRIDQLQYEVLHLRQLYGLTLQEAQALKSSESYRVGKAITWPVRRLRALLKPPRPAADPTPPDAPSGTAGPRTLVARSFAEERAWFAARRDTLVKQAVALKHRPLVSILVPVHDPPPDVLADTIASVAAQVYDHWELCIVDDGSKSRQTPVALERALAAVPPEKVRLQRRPKAGGIAVASNDALALARGEWTVLLDHDDLLTPDALLEVVRHANEADDADLIYSDEDKLSGDDRLEDLFLKPDFSPEYLLGINYLGHLCAVRTDLMRTLGGFREGFDGCQDHDLMLRATELARRVEHVPKVLYHWRRVPGSTADDPAAKGGLWREASRRAIADALERRGLAGTVTYGYAPSTYRPMLALPAGARVTVIIPIRDQVALLKSLLPKLAMTARDVAHEVLVVDNGSQEPETLRYLEEREAAGAIRVLRDDGPFNFSRLNNRAVAATDTEFILMMNNDVEPMDAGWLGAMLEWAQLPEIGAVGARLLYPDGRIQHAGVVLGPGGVAGHAHRLMPGDTSGYFGGAACVRNYSAVTAACLLTRRDVWDRVGGFNEDIAVNFNDVDFCMEVRRAGYRIVYTPHARLLHHESLSRGKDMKGKTYAQFVEEIWTMKRKWGEELLSDPYYHGRFRADSENFEAAEDPADSLAGQGAALRTKPSAELDALTAEALALREEAEEWFEKALIRRRSDYRRTWDALAGDRPAAMRAVQGGDDEAEFEREAAITLAVLDSTVGLRHDDVVVDIGCGVGRMAAAVGARVLRYIGFDVSERMVEHARRRCAAVANAEFHVCRGASLPFLVDGGVTVVFCTVVFMHLDEWDRHNYVLEAFRALAPGGRVFVDNFNLASDEGWAVFEAHRAIPHDDRPAHISRSSTADELRTYLERAGFADIRTGEEGQWVRAWGGKPG